MDTTTLGTIHSGERLKTSFVKIAISCSNIVVLLLDGSRNVHRKVYMVSK